MEIGDSNSIATTNRLDSLVRDRRVANYDLGSWEPKVVGSSPRHGHTFRSIFFACLRVDGIPLPPGRRAKDSPAPGPERRHAEPGTGVWQAQARSRTSTLPISAMFINLTLFGSRHILCEDRCRGSTRLEGTGGRTEMSDFVEVVDLSHQVHVINVRQIVRLGNTRPPNWDVVLTRGEPLALSKTEADKLLKTVPAVQTSSNQLKHNRGRDGK